MEVIDHLKGTSHKSPDVDSIFDFSIRTTASNVTKEALADIITDMIKQNKIINKRAINMRDLFRRNTLEFLVPLMKPLITLSNKTKKATKTKKSNGSLQQPAPSFNETDINTLCSCQQLAPEITTGEFCCDGRTVQRGKHQILGDSLV